ncbi:hypothetical protein [Sinorhizobium meliloti]|uniref:hypothetical protein n=1 Tax=Rhizobium meliloti TaxID=382 RepID=UPI00129578D6|nr:hypothetical protein [Sinorhizobium meliloti]MQU72472.1 hypothetical protein [Sinorhizobium meliloti]
MPQFNAKTISRLNGELVWRTKRKVGNGRVSYWDGKHLYSEWNGKPVRFDIAD